jgi:hypothetical protein
MVRAVADTVGGAGTIETALLLAADDATGPASFDYFLQDLTMPFDVHVNGEDHPARAFSEPRHVDFPSPVGSRPAYLFPFSDQVLYPRTMGVRTGPLEARARPSMVGAVARGCGSHGLGADGGEGAPPACDRPAPP